MVAPQKPQAFRERVESMFEGTPLLPPIQVAGGYPVELFERGDVEAIGGFQQRGAVELMRRGRGALALTFYIFARRDLYKGGQPGDELYQMGFRFGAAAAHDDDGMKSLVTDLVRGIATLTEARGIATVFEAWHAVRRLDEPRPPGKVEDWPDRTEVIYASLELPDGDHIWTAPITRYGGRGFSVGDFVKKPPAANQGRFAKLMDLDASSVPESVDIIRAWQQRERGQRAESEK
jgi:hypothetical protein